MRPLIYLYILLIVLVMASYFNRYKPHRLQVKSIDTMKFSRDMAREKLHDPSFSVMIDDQVAAIARMGVTHVAIGTPYDEEFTPYLKRWITAARSHGLKVWFRGNVSGWEQWFGYPKITKEMHTSLIEKFINNNPDLFEDGDVFTSCTECENGALGDPRNTGELAEYRQFLINEHVITNDLFREIGKSVETGYYPMNYDVALLVMDEATTSALGGVVVIDHYVPTPDGLVRDVRSIAAKSKGLIVLGEIGVPIASIHGPMTETERADWIDMALKELAALPEVIGVNYWVNMGGSTALWLKDGSETPTASVLRSYFLKQSTLF